MCFGHTQQIRHQHRLRLKTPLCQWATASRQHITYRPGGYHFMNTGVRMLTILLKKFFKKVCSVPKTSPVPSSCEYFHAFENEVKKGAGATIHISVPVLTRGWFGQINLTHQIVQLVFKNQLWQGFPLINHLSWPLNSDTKGEHTACTQEY